MDAFTRDFVPTLAFKVYFEIRYKRNNNILEQKTVSIHRTLLSFFYDDFCSAFDFFEKFQVFGYFAYYIDGTVGLCFSPEDTEGASHWPVC